MLFLSSTIVNLHRQLSFLIIITDAAIFEQTILCCCHSFAVFALRFMGVHLGFEPLSEEYPARQEVHATGHNRTIIIQGL